MENKFVHIYVLLDPEDGKIKYVGKTNDLIERQRGHNKDKKGNNKRVNWIKSLRKKDLFPILEEIDRVPHSEWQFWEMYWISQIKTWGFDLKNSTEGGEFNKSGYKHSKEVKEKISLSLKDRIFSKEHKSNLSKSKKGMEFSEKHKLNLSNSHLNQNVDYLKKKVCKINRDTGKLIKIYSSVRQAGKYSNIRENSISSCCKNKRKSAGGFYWCYKYDFNDYKFEKYKKNINIPPSAKAISQLNKDTLEVLMEFRSIKKASETLNIDRTQIYKCLNGRGKTAGGYKWIYVKNKTNA